MRLAARLSIAAVLAVLACSAGAVDARAAWTWPVEGEVLTAYRNGNDPYAAGQHRGIDIGAAVGSPVVAAAGGEVRFAGTAGSSGITVSIRTADGTYDTSYLHLASLAASKGDRVATGQRIGAVGSTGVRSTEQPHLHFGVRDAGTSHAYHDPLALLPPRGAPPERPRPSPVPVLAPTRPHPVPLSRPVPRSAPRPLPDGAPRPLPGPLPRRAPAPRPAPTRAPRGLPMPVPRTERSPRPVPVPHGIRAHAPERVPAPGRAPVQAPAGQPAPAPGRSPLPAEARLPSPTASTPAATAPPPPADPRGGPDLGWALACLGLLLAAAVLGLSEDGRSGTRTGRSRVAGALRPLLGRR